MKRLFLFVMAISMLFFCACGCNGGKQSEVSSGESVDLKKLVDFTVEVEEGKEITVLQLSDPQIIDSAQRRRPNRLDSILVDYWSTDSKEERCFKYMREVIEATDPDLIIMTGDIIYGEFDDEGTCLTALIEFMEGFNIPWAPVIGNHEGESRKGIDWICEQLIIAKNCLFRQRVLTGNGNYTVGITQGGELKRVFFMMDSNGYSELTSDETFENGHSVNSVGFESDQIEWMKSEVAKIKEKSPKTHFSLAFHIPIKAFVNAWGKYGFINGTTKDLIDLDEVGKDGDFGLISGQLGFWDSTTRTWRAIKECGFDSVFVGHEHTISASVVYEGVRLQFGQKSSTYDSLNYVTADGRVVSSYNDAGTPLVGGTVIPLGSSGELGQPYIMLCDE